MNEVMNLYGAEPRKILQAAIDSNVAAIMSYSSRAKTHVVKVMMFRLQADSFAVEILPAKKPRPVNIWTGQPATLSFKHEFGKFIFETKVIDLEPSPNSLSGGIIVLANPMRIESVQRRSYFRVRIPKGLKVNVKLWHRSQPGSHRRTSPEHYRQGVLVDISAGGAQVAVDITQKPDFKEGQSISLCFTPMPYEAPLTFDAHIRELLPAADGTVICLGLQAVGLESSQQGRDVLQRLCSVVERYYEINQYGVKQQDLQAASY